jgi:nitric oxide reductase subunit C
MTKRQTRLFFAVGTTVFAAVFVGLTIDSHRQFGALTHAEAITPPVIAGKHVWHRKNCINCHTLLGEGAYYAPDLTKITQQRGDVYLRQFLQDPSRFYSEERHGRVMPNLNLSDEQITNVIAFLGWVSNIDNQGWPPRPIVVSAALPQDMSAGARPAGAASTNPVALGEAVFRRSPPACFSCHSTTAGTVLVGPSLAGLATRAAGLVGRPDYKGAARSAPDYIRESILNPGAYVVPGPTFGAGGQSIMPPFGTLLKPEEVDQLVAYLATFN